MEKDSTSKVKGGEPSPVQRESVVHALLRQTEANPSKSLWTYVNGKGSPSASYTYAEAEEATRGLAHALLAPCTAGGAGLSRGDRALLVYPPGLDFVIAFFACLRAGVIAVPVYPPHPGRLKRDLSMFCSVQESCGATVALTNTKYDYAKRMAGIKSVFTGAKWPSLSWTVTDKVKASACSGDDAKLDDIGKDDIAFLQYTSGSTSAPKGVVVSHSNLAHNLECICRALEAKEDTVVVSWLPQYHDMGLIGSIMGAMYAGGCGVYVSPLDFIKDPPLWIRLISEHKATHLQAPNFAYKLVSRKWGPKGVSGWPH